MRRTDRLACRTHCSRKLPQVHFLNLRRKEISLVGRSFLVCGSGRYRRGWDNQEQRHIRPASLRTQGSDKCCARLQNNRRVSHLQSRVDTNSAGAPLFALFGKCGKLRTQAHPARSPWIKIHDPVPPPFVFLGLTVSTKLYVQFCAYTMFRKEHFSVFAKGVTRLQLRNPVHSIQDGHQGAGRAASDICALIL